MSLAGTTSGFNLFLVGYTTLVNHCSFDLIWLHMKLSLFLPLEFRSLKWIEFVNFSDRPHAYKNTTLFSCLFFFFFVFSFLPSTPHLHSCGGGESDIAYRPEVLKIFEDNLKSFCIVLL